MYDIVKPVRIAIYINSNYKTMEQIQSELGCDYLINGGTFDGNFKPCCWLKVDGKVLHTESWSDWGFGWNDGPDIRMDTSVNIKQYRNFISCVSMISPGPFIVPSEMGGCRGRTAFGLTADSRVIPFCTQEGKEHLWPEELRQKMLSLGATSALMLDGGTSSRCMFPNGKIPANKIKGPYLQNYIAIWTHTPDVKPVLGCPYAEPKHTVGRWCLFYSKDEARWVQWMLRAVYDPTLNVDGSFGKLSDAALRGFQRKVGIVDDGKCGKISREKLNEEYRRLKK